MDTAAITEKLSGVVDFELGGRQMSYSYMEAGLFVFLIFALVLMFGQLRHRLVHWHMKGIVPGAAMGFMIAVILEGILLIGGGSLITRVVGWQDAPKPIATALDAGREQLVDVLSATDEVVDKKDESGDSDKATIGGIMEQYTLLNESEADSLRGLICTQ